MINDSIVRKYIESHNGVGTYLLKDAGEGEFIAVWEMNIPEPTPSDIDQARDALRNEWILSEAAAYRDQRIEDLIEFNGYTVRNNSRTRAALLENVSKMLLQGPETATVNWETVNGFFDLNTQDIQGLYVSCINHQQKCFDAKMHVEALNAVTAFTSVEAMKAEFDLFMNSLGE